MEPATLITSALLTGAAAGLGESATQIIKDAYWGLKGLIQKHFANNAKAEMILAEYEQEPEIWEEPLKRQLVETGAVKDQKVIEQAQKLLELVQSQQVGVGKYNVQIGQAKGTIIGDYSRVEMKFSDRDDD